MSLIPAFLSLVGLFLGPQIAKKLNNCPHRGRVWGAFLSPLLAAIHIPLLLPALATSLVAALAVGFTAHKPFKVSLCATVVSCLCAALLLKLWV